MLNLPSLELTNNKLLIVVMGVSGSGKTTIGKRLGKALELPFYDADAFHPQSNIDKMSAGTSLTDADRLPWLKAMAQAMQSWEQGGILACSALKESYRTILAENNAIEWVFLQGDAATIQKRMEARDHFMKPTMLQSQFDDLEPPSYGITVSITEPVERMVSKILTNLEHMKLQWGIVGLGVMGRSLAKNALGKGHRLAVYNRATQGEEEVVPHFLSAVTTKNAQGFTDLEAFVASLATPRKILLMIPAGNAVDEVLDALTPLLTPGDVVMDGGNSHYKDTQRRVKYLAPKGIHYLGVGISGGEQGALKAPSMMAGGSKEGYQWVKALLEDIGAKDAKNRPCVALLGADGAGHFIKTVHNGIEYAEMQLLAEVYGLLRPTFSYPEIRETLVQWNAGETKSYLLELTLHIFQKKEGDAYLLDQVLDVASSKGTGVWSSIAALEAGVPATQMVEAVMARHLSGDKAARKRLDPKVSRPQAQASIDREALKKAYQFARILNHFQGLELIRSQSQQEGWNVSLKKVTQVWTEGCIIKSAFMKQLATTLEDGISLWDLPTLFEQLKASVPAVQSVLGHAITQQIAVPCLTSAWNYWLGSTTQNSTAHLIQAQRDAFGAHTFQRVDRPNDQSFTANWTDHG